MKEHFHWKERGRGKGREISENWLIRLLKDHKKTCHQEPTQECWTLIIKIIFLKEKEWIVNCIVKDFLFKLKGRHFKIMNVLVQCLLQEFCSAD